MGLDMYLERFPRIKDLTPSQIYGVSELFSFERECEKNENARKYTLEQWCGINPSTLPDAESIEALRGMFRERFPYWDDEHEYPTWEIYEQIGYWRKANEVHNWFVTHVQDGIDDCDYHREVTREDLIELRDLCNKVLAETHLVPGKIISGYQWVDGEEKPIEIDGLVVEDDSACIRYLPCTSGFFFGSTDYDEWYINDLKNTVEICTNALDTTDFDTQMIFYCSSW